ncbi:hypothetical protein GCM10020218_058200 [Dactylosporangium vinaceum]
MVVLGTDGPTGPTERIAAHADAPVVVAPVVRPPGGPVVLGVDGSYLAPEAAAFAFEEAALRGVPLVAMYAWPGVADVALSGVDPFGYDVSVARGDAYRVLAEALAGWAAKYPRRAGRAPRRARRAHRRAAHARGGGGVDARARRPVAHRCPRGRPSARSSATPCT